MCTRYTTKSSNPGRYAPPADQSCGRGLRKTGLVCTVHQDFGEPFHAEVWSGPGTPLTRPTAAQKRVLNTVILRRGQGAVAVAAGLSLQGPWHWSSLPVCLPHSQAPSPPPSPPPPSLPPDVPGMDPRTQPCTPTLVSIPLLQGLLVRKTVARLIPKFRR